MMHVEDISLFQLLSVSCAFASALSAIRKTGLIDIMANCVGYQVILLMYQGRLMPKVQRTL